jgi:hypothetical protein
MIPNVQIQESVIEALEDEEEPPPPTIDSSKDASYDLEFTNERVRRRSNFPRYDSEHVIPTFYVGMISLGRKEFEDALIKYGLQARMHLLFPKDEKCRIRSRCSWKDCHWGLHQIRLMVIGFRLNISKCSQI